MGQLSGRAGVQVNHSRPQLGRFQSHHLAQTPQDRAGKLPRTLALQYLRPARDKPHALLRYHIGIGHTLHQRQRACSDAVYVRRNLRGGCLCPVTVQRLEMHHALERHIRRQALDE